MKLPAASVRRQQTPWIAKAAIVAGGYAAALLLAFCVLWIYVARTSGPDREVSDGMYAFGDFLVFIAVFGFAAAVPTGFAVYFLRQNRVFWIACSVVALAVAGTGIAAVAANILESQGVALGGGIELWTMVAFPRIFISPCLAASFGLAAMIAPEARFRWLLAGAAFAEVLSSAYGFLHWFAPLFFG